MLNFSSVRSVLCCFYIHCKLVVSSLILCYIIASCSTISKYGMESSDYSLERQDIEQLAGVQPKKEIMIMQWDEYFPMLLQASQEDNIALVKALIKNCPSMLSNAQYNDLNNVILKLIKKHDDGEIATLRLDNDSISLNLGFTLHENFICFSAANVYLESLIAMLTHLRMQGKLNMRYCDYNPNDCRDLSDRSARGARYVGYTLGQLIITQNIDNEVTIKQVLPVLLKTEFDINTKSRSGRTVAHMVASGTSPSGRAISLATLQYIFGIDGIDLNSQDSSRVTPLLAAISAHNDDCVEILLKNPAVHLVENKHGYGPLDYALYFMEELLEFTGLSRDEVEKKAVNIVRLLLKDKRYALERKQEMLDILDSSMAREDKINRIKELYSKAGHPEYSIVDSINECCWGDVWDG